MIQMFINNEEVVSNKEFTITEEMLATSSTILNNCYPKSWEDNQEYTNSFYYPKDYSKCKILKDNQLIFCGVVKNSGNISLNPRYPHFCSLQILDFKTFLSEGETLDFVINNKTIQEAIEMVIDAIKDYGFILGNIQILNANDVIGAYSTLEKTAYDVFQYLADISGSRWFTRTIDENTIAIDFYDPTLMQHGNNIKYNTQYFENNNIQDISFNYGSRDYRNKQVMLSDEVYADIDYTQSFNSDGFTRTYTTTNNIGILKKVLYDGVNEVSFATNKEKELGIDADYYYTVGSNTIEQNENRSVPIAGRNITVVYTPLVKGRQIVYNTDEVNRINSQTGRKGVIARYENRKDVLSSEELNKVGQSYIRYKGSAEVNLKVVTKDKDLYNIGQIVYFEAPINDLTQDYMIKKKETKIIATGSDFNIWYTYELSSSFNSERAINYFDNQRNKSTGNILAGEFITRNIDIENTANIIFRDLTVTEITANGDNILDCVLDSPFNN